MPRRWRAYAPRAVPGEPLALSPEESHHVRRVLRLAPGDEIAVFDGRGGEWTATIEGHDGSTVVARVGDEVPGDVECPIEVRLFQACARADKLDGVVSKGTEMGLAAIVAVHAERAGPAAVRRLDRLRRIAVESAKQCGRRRLPAIDAADALPAPADGAVAVVLHPGTDAGLDAACDRARGAPAVWLAVGPEGGFAPEEIAAATAAGWRPAGLGPRILRTETAGLVAAAIVLHRLGDLGTSRALPGRDPRT
jgi:16S rRNA (uracil1498-N3)-methyltransferase